VVGEWRVAWVRNCSLAVDSRNGVHQRQGDISARVPSSASAANSRGTAHEAVRLLVLVKKRALQRGARTPKGARGWGSSE
jgi:hypothetical protein